MTLGLEPTMGHSHPPLSCNQVLPCFPFQTAILRRQGRYVCSTVPASAQEEAQSLFVTEVMCLVDVGVRVSSMIKHIDTEGQTHPFPHENIRVKAT